jgi:RNA recognition motif-containing protein
MTNQSRGFGFVEMSDDTAAKKAIAELDQAAVEGRTIKVVEAKPKEDRPTLRKSPFRDNGNSYKTNRW